MTGTKRRRPLGAIVAAVVGGLMLLCSGGTMLGLGLDDDAPWGPVDYVFLGAVAVGACLAFASAVLAGRRPFAAGLLASLAVLPIGGVLPTVTVFAESQFGSTGLLGGLFAFLLLMLWIVAWLLLAAGPCVLAAILNFRRWRQERQRDLAVTTPGEEEGSE